MDVQQAKRQLVFLAARATWPDSPNGLVFTRAIDSEDLEGAFARGSWSLDGPRHDVLPFVRCSCHGFSFDEETPGRIARMHLRLWHVAGGGSTWEGATTRAAFDTHGENMETSALQTSYGTSTGKSIDQLIGAFMGSLGNGGQLIGSTHGLQGFARVAETTSAVDGVQVVARALHFEIVDGTVAPYFHNARGLTATPSGGHTVALSWTKGPLRYDTVGYALFRGTNPGDPAPAYGGGTPITIAGTSATDTLGGSGLTYNYSLFATYAETPAGILASTVERTSSGLTVQVVTT